MTDLIQQMHTSRLVFELLRGAQAGEEAAPSSTGGRAPPADEAPLHPAPTSAPPATR